MENKILCAYAVSGKKANVAQLVEHALGKGEVIGSIPIIGSIIIFFNFKFMEFDYTTTTTKAFDEAVQSVQDEITKAGMSVLYIHDVQKTLVEKDFEREPFKIIEFCNAKFADEFLNKDIKIGLCLPCKINVYTKDGHTFVSGMRPIVLSQFFPKADLGDKPKEIDQIIQSIINAAK